MTTIISPSGQKNNEFATWDITKKYRVGDLVIFNQKIYETTTEIPAGTAFDPADPASPWAIAVVADTAQDAVNAQHADSADEALALDAPDTTAVKIGGGTLGQVLKSLGDGTTEWGDVAGGGGTPGGANTQVQFNDNGVFGAASSFTFVADTDTVTVQNLAITGEINTALVPSANVAYDLGSAALRWKDLYLSNNTIYMGDQTISATASDIEFSGGIISGSVALTNGGTISESSISGTVSATTIALKPAGGIDADQQLLVYPTAAGDFNHLHLTSGNLFNTELFLGNDDLYVKLANTGNVVINSNDNNGATGQWAFATDKSLTLPQNGSINGEEMTLAGIGNINVTVGGAQQWAFGANGALVAANTTAEFLGTSDQEITLRAGGLNIGTIDNLVDGGAVNDFAFVAGNAAAGDSPAAGGAVTITTGRGGQGLNGNDGGAGGAFIVSTGLGGSCDAGASPGASGEIILTTTDSLPATGVPGVTSGPITLVTGNGGDSDTDNAGTSGEIIISTGNGGTGGEFAWAGDAGDITLTTGNGGNVIPGGTSRDASRAGTITLQGGVGGSSPTRGAGRGGSIDIIGGEGGVGGDRGGSGGSINIESGPGIDCDGGEPGEGGYVSITAGSAGSSSTGYGGTANGVEIFTGNGGDGGDASGVDHNGGTPRGDAGEFRLVTGNGGSVQIGEPGFGGNVEIETGVGGNTTQGNAGNAGNMTITLGNGGESSDGNGGTGGSLTLTAGNGGAGSSNNGASGSITLTTQAGSLVLDPTGKITLPTVNGEQAAFTGTRTIVTGDTVNAVPNTPTVVYTAPAKALKISFTITHTTNSYNLETEFFDLVVAKGFTDTLFSVSNRLNTFGSGVAGANDTVVTVAVNGNNEIEISLETKIGTAAAVAYSVTEFKN